MSEIKTPNDYLVVVEFEDIKLFKRSSIIKDKYGDYDKSKDKFVTNIIFRVRDIIADLISSSRDDPICIRMAENAMVGRKYCGELPSLKYDNTGMAGKILIPINESELELFKKRHWDNLINPSFFDNGNHVGCYWIIGIINGSEDSFWRQTIFAKPILEQEVAK